MERQISLVHKAEDLVLNLDETLKLLHIFTEYCLNESDMRWSKPVMNWKAEEHRKLGEDVCRFMPLLRVIGDRISAACNMCTELTKLICGDDHEDD